MKRLLCIVSSMDRGGAETFLMKVYRCIDRTKYQMDFCVSKTTKGYYDDEIKEMGGKIYIVPQKSKNPFKSFFTIKNIVKQNKYTSVLRTSQQSLATLDLLAARCGGAKKLIYRSSNANITGGSIKRLLNRAFSFLPKIVPNVKIAPSTEAAEFVFGKNSIKKGKVTILRNGLDYCKFEFNTEIRNKLRKKLALDDKIIFGHIGRFNVQKNHLFLLDIFNEIYKQNDNARLVIIGEGELEQDIRQKIDNLQLNDCVKILGPQGNINEYLMAFDMLIFPSFFEGMPNVIIEAEASGLKAVLSDTITREANITPLLTYVSLDKSAKEWANIILTQINYKRCSYKKEFSEKGYIMQDVIDVYTDKLF